MMDICIRYHGIIQQVCNPRRGTIATSHYISTSIRSWHRRQRKCTCGHRVGEERKGETNWESSINIHTLPRVKQIAIGKLLYTTQWAQLRALWWPGRVEWRGRWEEAQEGGVCVYIQPIHFVVQRKHNIVNQLSSNKKREREREIWCRAPTLSAIFSPHIIKENVALYFPQSPGESVCGTKHWCWECTEAETSSRILSLACKLPFICPNIQILTDQLVLCLSYMLSQDLPICLFLWVRRYPGEGNGSPLQYSCWENPMDKRSLVGCSPWVAKESHTT